MIRSDTFDSVGAAARVGASQLLQKAGGIAALLLGLFDVAFLAAFLFILPGLGFDTSMFRDPPRFVAFVNSHYAIYYAIALAGVLVTPTIVVLVRALDERLRAASASASTSATGSSSLVAIAAAFGYIGSTMLLLNWLFQYTGIVTFNSAPPAFSAQVQASVTFDMTNMGAYLTLGVWALLLGWEGMRTHGLPTWFAFLGILVAVSGLLVLFGLPLGALLMAIWFMTIGIVLVAGKTPEAQKDGVR